MILDETSKQGSPNYLIFDEQKTKIKYLRNIVPALKELPYTSRIAAFDIKLQKMEKQDHIT